MDGPCSSLGWAVALLHRSPMEPWQLKSNCFCHSLLSLPPSSSSPPNGTSSQALGIADQVSHSDPMEALDGPSQTTLSLPIPRPGTPLDRAGLLGIVRQGSWAPLSAQNMLAWSLGTDPLPWGREVISFCLGLSKKRPWGQFSINPDFKAGKGREARLVLQWPWWGQRSAWGVPPPLLSTGFQTQLLGILN